MFLMPRFVLSSHCSNNKYNISCLLLSKLVFSWFMVLWQNLGFYPEGNLELKQTFLCLKLLSFYFKNTVITKIANTILFMFLMLRRWFFYSHYIWMSMVYPIYMSGVYYTLTKCIVTFRTHIILVISAGEISKPLSTCMLFSLHTVPIINIIFPVCCYLN
jgi:hypothetical protein